MSTVGTRERLAAALPRNLAQPYGPGAEIVTIVVLDGPPDDPVSVRLVMRTTSSSWRARGISAPRVLELRDDVERSPRYDVPCELRGQLQRALDPTPGAWAATRRLWHAGACPPCDG